MKTFRYSVIATVFALALSATTKPAHADVLSDIADALDTVVAWVRNIGNDIDNWFDDVFDDLESIAADVEATGLNIKNFVEEQAIAAEPFVNNAVAFGELRVMELEDAVVSVITGMETFNPNATILECVGPCAEFRDDMLLLLAARQEVEDISLGFSEITPSNLPSIEFDLDLIETAPAFVLYPIFLSMEASLGGNVSDAVDSLIESVTDLEDLVAMAQGEVPGQFGGAVQKVGFTSNEGFTRTMAEQMPGGEEPFCTQWLAQGDTGFSVGRERIGGGNIAALVLTAASVAFEVSGETRIEEQTASKVIKNNRSRKIALRFSKASEFVSQVTSSANQRLQTCEIIRVTLLAQEASFEGTSASLLLLQDARNDISVGNELLGEQIDGVQVSLYETQGQLARTQSQLTETQVQLAETQAKLRRANDNILETGQKLDAALQELEQLEQQQTQMSENLQQVLRILMRPEPRPIIRLDG